MAIQRRVILEINLWEYVQPDWIWPVTPEKMGAIERIGFHAGKIVWRKTKNGFRAVIWVVERNQQ